MGIQHIDEIAMFRPRARQENGRWFPVYPDINRGDPSAPAPLRRSFETEAQAVQCAQRMTEDLLTYAIALSNEIEWRGDRKCYAGVVVERVAHPDAVNFEYRRAAE